MLKRYTSDSGLTVTINTTEDCNLRCKYCYEINKKKKTIPIEYCKRFVDLIFSDNDPCGFSLAESSDLNKGVYHKGLIMDFIGGDALMNVEILDEIMSYTLKKLLTTNSENAAYWRNHLRFSISSNGTLFSRPEVRTFCEKWAKYNLLSVGVSVDGCPEIHDKNRIMAYKDKDGNEVGSMKYILENWEWYKKTFSKEDVSSTKATLSRESIPYLFDSLQFMHQKLGLIQINQNFIMEDMNATEEDYKELDSQMKKCVEYVLKHNDKLYWSMIDKDKFAKHKLSKNEEWDNKGHCGSGAMPCLGINVNIYPCFRWAPHTQNKDNPEPVIVGNIQDGFFNKEGFAKVRNGAIRCNCTRKEECKNCIYESACSYCIGGCYAEFQDFIRTTHICEITKIQCKWAKVYWNEYNKLHNMPLEFNEEWQLDRVKPWSKPMSTTEELDY